MAEPEGVEKPGQAPGQDQGAVGALMALEVLGRVKEKVRAQGIKLVQEAEDTQVLNSVLVEV